MLLLLISLVLLPLLAILVIELVYYKTKRVINRIPGPPTLPLLGNAHLMGNNPTDIFNQLFLWWNKYGNNFRVWVGYFPNVVISEVKDVEFVLTSNTLLKKSDIYDMLHPWLGMGLLTSYGSKWHKHRKMITPSFHFKILQNFHEVMNANSTKFMSKLEEAARGETIFDFQEMAQYFTLDVICETAMGVSINAMDNSDADIVNAFKDICYNINMRAFHPIKRKNYLYKFAPDYAEYLKTLKVLQDFTNEIIEMRMKVHREAKGNASPVQEDPQEEGFTRRKMAFLDTLLTSTIDGRSLNQQEIYEEVSTFMFEGHDTTTSGISFAAYLLSRHPEVQQKVLAEQQRILDGNLNREVTFQDIAEMKYLDLFLKESQRLYPSVPAIGRDTDKDYNINGTFIPKNTTINVLIMAMGYNEKTFPDAYRCNPERFLPENREGKPNPFEYVPFSAGPRNCIGQKFALLEIKTVISKMVRTFEILPPLDELASKDGYVANFPGLSVEEQKRRRPNPSKYDPLLSMVLTLKSENGIQIRLRPRV